MRRGRKPRCPYCGANGNISKGVRKTVGMGVRRLRVCKYCCRKFTVGRVVHRSGRPAQAESGTASPVKPIEPQQQQLGMAQPPQHVDVQQ